MREGWDLKTLEDLFDIGSSKRVYESQWRNAGVPFYRAREIVKLSRDGYVDNELFIDDELYEEYANKYGIPKCGDLMVTGVGTLGVCYIVRENDKFYFKDGNILWFKSKEGTNPFYVNYAFKSNYLRQQIENCNGATVGTFTIVRAKKTKIPVPPLAEQEQIVAELDLLSGIIEKKKEQLKAYDQLAQSIFYTMFGDPIDNPKGWETKKLSEVFETVTDFVAAGSFANLRENVEYLSEPNFAQLVRTVDLKSNFSKKSFVYVNEHAFNYLWRVNLNKECIILPNVGVNCGESYFVSPILLPYRNNVLGPNAILVRSEKYSHLYLLYFIRTSFFQAQIDEITNAVGQPKFNKTELKRLIVCIPPLSLQEEFAEKVEAIERQKALVQQSIEETQTMFDYTMDKYFG